MIGFRVDANEKIASGHLMRCMAIAEMCRRQGEDVCFFLAEEKETERLQDRAFPYVIMHTDWQEMEAEIPVLEQKLDEQGVSALVVDSYQATPVYLDRLNGRFPVLYLDDMGKDFYPVTVVLHYGIGTDTEEYLKKYESQGVRVLAGTSYIPLREEFMPELDQNTGREHRILVTTGGTDPFRIAERFLRACFSYGEEDGIFLKKWDYDVIVGALNHHTEGLEQMAEEDPRIHLHYNVPNMSDYMKNCKLAVSAGGTTLYELCACGIPAACFSFADNQEPGALLFEKNGLMDYAGDARKAEVEERLVKSLICLKKDQALYKERKERMMRTVDGMGALRIAKELYALVH